MNFAVWERVVLTLAIAVSAGIFGRDLAAKIRLVTAGRSDRPRTDRLGARVWRVVREVIFQSRVVGGRPVAGLLHAVVFLGFVAFGLETVDHFLEPYGLPFLEVIFRGAEPLFHAFLAVVAVAVAVAISGLAFRRFVLKKISPDPKSWSSLVVAILIVLLMVTFLNDVAASPLLPKANWWLHAAIILVFPHLILRSKHFHILMAPVDIFFRTHRLGDLLPLDLSDEELAVDGAELGLESMKTAPWKMRLDFLTCVECKRCTDSCPANLAGQELDPRGFVLAGRRTLTELAADAAVVGNVLTETALGQCTSCGACEAICPVGIEHLQILTGAKRAQALALGTGMVATDFLQKVERYGNPFAAGADTRAKLISDLGIPIYEEGSTEWLLWLGCVWGYNQDARRPATALVEVLQRAGVSFGVLEEEACCGHHSRRQGEEMQFQTLAQQNLETLAAVPSAKVVTPCPHCLHTLRREYPTIRKEFAPRVVHHSELLAGLVASGKIQLRSDGRGEVPTTYHDPCYLGRYEETYEPPRELVAAAGYRLQELPRRRARSYCCGGGSAGFAREQEVARRVDQERKEEIAASGAKLLVVSCPECKMMLDSAVERTLDVAELVAEAMAPPPAAG
ncbi:MAG: (Fe-S)-binding protein [Thermoanaerobaculia bacterium]|nr:(Fe-S)-binding protein [Thermoanaerobaculia bacterium]